MTTETSIHAWFAERISAYLTDGLDTQERSEFESHAGQCATCAVKLADAKLADEILLGMFEEIGPAAGFEDRVIRRLRTDGRMKFALLRPVRLHPMVMRAAGAAAAIIVLGGLGYNATLMIQGRHENGRVASNLRQIGQGATSYDFNGPRSAQMMLNASSIQNPTKSLAYSYANSSPDKDSLGPGFKMVPGLQQTFAVAADINPGHHKEGQNVFGSSGSDVSEHAKNLVSQQLTSSAPQVSSYLYADRIPAPTPGHTVYFEPKAAGTPVAEGDAAIPAERQHRTDALADVRKQQQMSASADLERNTMFRNVVGDKSGDNAPPPPVAVAPKTPTTPPAADEGVSSRKVIRHGEMSFEVDSFDSAFMQITKIAAEEGGFISDTDSEKLANGKMSGTISVRVPPDHLDTLALKLRALGDLKGQKINADDVTKEYTDLQSELRAATAMEDRLLEIIKTGNGQVKDLLAAEKEVGVWREKVEKVTGEINYYNNLISLSTLQITLTERDIRQAALASERETVDMGVEMEDVEKARADALRTLDAAKARIIQADLKKLDAGQLAATIIAQIPPDAAGPVVDHFKQLGRVARLNIDRQQTVADGATVPAGIKVERLDTQLQVSLYNLANVSPRQTTNVSVACPDVETAYHAIINAVAEAGGRVVNSSLNRIKPDQTDGVVSFESPRDKADSILASVRALGEVMHMTVTENPDAANVTNAKEGFAVTLASKATVAPRETIVSTLMPDGNMAAAYQAVRAVVQANHGNITTAQLQEQISQSDSANLVFDVGREHQSEIENAIAKSVGTAGRVISRQDSRSDDTEHTLDSKVQFSLTFVSADTLQPREAITRVVAVADVSAAYSQILGAAQQAGAKVAGAALDQSDPSNPSGQLDLIVSRDQVDAVEKAIADTKGGTISRSVSRSADLNSTTDEKVELRLTLGDLNQLPPRQTTTINVEVSDPESALGDLQAAALTASGRVVEQHLIKDDKYQAHLVVEVPLAKASELIDEARGSGTVKTIERSENLSVPVADFAKAKLDITLTAAGSIVGPDAGLWAGLKGGIGASIRGLAYSLELVVIGVCLALPWAVLVWLGWKMVSRFRRKTMIA
jgi:hypothetical protein